MNSDIDLLSPDFIRNPYPAYQRLRDEHPVSWHAGTGYWFLTRCDDVHAALRNPLFRSGRMLAFFDGITPEKMAELRPLLRLLEPRILFAEGTQHQKLRGLLSQVFTPRQIELMRPLVRQTIDELVRDLKGRREFDFVREFADPLPSRVVCRILGLPAECFEQFKLWTNDIYEFIGVSSRDRTSRAERANAAAAEIEVFLARELHNRQPRPGPDLLSLLAKVEESGQQLSRAEIVANVVGLLNAGHETTTNLIGSGMYLLLNHPEQWRRLRADPALTAPAIEEIARYESPVQFLGRQLSEPVTIHGQELSAGANVLLLLGAANRDPRVFARADEFDIARSGPRHLAYGFGPHFCIGAAVARLVAEEALKRVVSEWHTVNMRDDVRWRPYPVFRGLEALNLIVN